MSEKYRAAHFFFHRIIAPRPGLLGSGSDYLERF